MPLKDPEKRKKYQDKYNRQRRKGVPHDSRYDFETHHELACNSGIQTQREWRECHHRGFMPDGMYYSPEVAFRRK